MMQKWNRFFCGSLLAGCLLAGSVSASAALSPVQQYPQGKFTDVPESAWFAGTVKGCYEYGLMGGTSADTFSPNAGFTVAEAMTAAARLHSLSHGGSGQIPAAQGPWYQGAVNYCLANGIAEEGQFNSYIRNAQRNELAYLLAHAMPEDTWTKRNDVTRVPDVDDSTPYADEILLLYQAGIFTGSDAYGMFSPYMAITRAEVATMVYRCVDESQRQTLNLQPLSQRPAVAYNAPWSSRVASELEDYDGLIPFKDQATGLYGFMDLAGKTVIPASYTTVPDPFENGWAEVNDGRGDYYNALIDQLGGVKFRDKNLFQTEVYADHLVVLRRDDHILVDGKDLGECRELLDNGYYLRGLNEGCHIEKGYLFNAEHILTEGELCLVQKADSEQWQLYDDHGNYLFALDSLHTYGSSPTILALNCDQDVGVYENENQKAGAFNSSGVVVTPMYDRSESFGRNAVVFTGDTGEVVGPSGNLFGGPVGLIKYDTLSDTMNYVVVDRGNGQEVVVLKDGEIALTLSGDDTDLELVGDSYLYSEDSKRLYNLQGRLLASDVRYDNLLRYNDRSPEGWCVYLDGGVRIFNPDTGAFTDVTYYRNSWTEVQNADDTKTRWIIVQVDPDPEGGEGTCRFQAFNTVGDSAGATVTAPAADLDAAKELLLPYIKANSGDGRYVERDNGATLVEYDPDTGEKTTLIGPYQGNFKYDSISYIGDGAYLCQFGKELYIRLV